MADCMQFLSENRLNRCQIFGWFGFLKKRIRTKFWFSAHPYCKEPLSRERHTTSRQMCNHKHWRLVWNQHLRLSYLIQWHYWEKYLNLPFRYELKLGMRRSRACWPRTVQWTSCILNNTKQMANMSFTVIDRRHITSGDVITTAINSLTHCQWRGHQYRHRVRRGPCTMYLRMPHMH